MQEWQELTPGPEGDLNGGYSSDNPCSGVANKISDKINYYGD